MGTAANRNVTRRRKGRPSVPTPDIIPEQEGEVRLAGWLAGPRAVNTSGAMATGSQPSAPAAVFRRDGSIRRMPDGKTHILPLQRVVGNRTMQRMLEGRVARSETGRFVQRVGEHVEATDEEAIRVGGSSGREVPEHLDRELAAIERASQGTVANATNEFLVHMARSRNEYLLHPPSPIGPQTRIATAETLILIYDTLDARIAQAPMGENGIPVVEGLRWDPEDPNAGLLEAIPPFGMYDAWQALAREEPTAEEPQPERRRRRPTPEPTPTPTPERTEPEQAPMPPAEVLRRSLSLTAADTFAHWFLAHYGICMRLNPGRMTRTSWWRHGGERAHFVGTFRRPLDADIERLRQIVSGATQITREVEDSIEFLSFNRRSLQQTVDSWTPGFEQSGTEGENAFGWQSEPEWQVFRQLMIQAGFPEPENRISIPYRNHPRF